MTDLQSKIPEIITGIISLFSASPVLGAIVAVLVVGAIAGLTYWYNGVKNDAAHAETEAKREQDLTNIVKEGQDISNQANGAADEIDALRKKP